MKIYLFKLNVAAVAGEAADEEVAVGAVVNATARRPRTATGAAEAACATTTATACSAWRTPTATPDSAS